MKGKKIQKLEFRQSVVLSTAHLRQETVEGASEPGSPLFEWEYGVACYCGCGSHPDPTVPNEGNKTPEDLMECRRFVLSNLPRKKRKKHTYIWFDRDGPVMEGLKTYDW